MCSNDKIDKKPTEPNKEMALQHCRFDCDVYIAIFSLSLSLTLRGCILFGNVRQHYTCVSKSIAFVEMIIQQNKRQHWHQKPIHIILSTRSRLHDVRLHWFQVLLHETVNQRYPFSFTLSFVDLDCAAVVIPPPQPHHHSHCSKYKRFDFVFWSVCGVFFFFFFFCLFFKLIECNRFHFGFSWSIRSLVVCLWYSHIQCDHFIWNSSKCDQRLFGINCNYFTQTNCIFEEEKKRSVYFFLLERIKLYMNSRRIQIAQRNAIKEREKFYIVWWDFGVCVFVWSD